MCTKKTPSRNNQSNVFNLNILGDISPFNVLGKPSIIKKPLSRCKCGSTDHKKTSHHSCKYFKDKTTVNPLIVSNVNEINSDNLLICNQVNNIQLI